MIENKNRTTFAGEDFLDFSYNGKKASEMGLIKVNTGKRQDDIVLPASKDTTIDIPGSDGTYYLKGKYQQREFTINFAYDGIYEDDIRKIREWLAPQKECPLIFSERPYKYYMAKPKSAPKLSYIAFDDNNGVRVYRGEGSIQFVCYFPWARSVSRYAGDLVGVTSQQLAESGLLAGKSEVLKLGADNSVRVPNGGDMPTPFKFIFKVAGSGGQAYASISLKHKDSIKAQIYLDCNYGWSKDRTYLFDSESHLILSIKNVENKNGKITYDIEESKGNATIMNGAIVAGDFFDIPVSMDGDNIPSIIVDAGFVDRDNSYFLYDYLYY